MKILSIETSCDETAVSIIEASGDLASPKFSILGNALYSQISTHAEYGGVFPALAKREHTLNLVPMLKLATSYAFDASLSSPTQSHGNSLTRNAKQNGNIELTDELRKQILEILNRENDLGPALLEFLDTHEVYEVDAIAVTQGPGLEPALWVGISFAKALAVALNKPLIPINHMEGHIVSVLTESSELNNANSPQANNANISRAKNPNTPTVQFPALALLISGGHTELVLSKDWHQYEIIGQTVDDAVGEAFDKVARIIGLPYPGGPKISKLAKESREEELKKKYPELDWQLPRPMIKSPDFNFSFSGLKTAVLYAVRDRLQQRETEKRTPESVELSDIEQKILAEEFENAVTDVLTHKTRRAIEETNSQTLIIGGGVIANTYIREAFKKVAEETGVKLFTPSISLSTDNSVMIGVAGYLRWIAGDAGILQPSEVMSLTAKGNLSL
ncbi:MAG: tRNA (adenosine(37)-N6)-threonylcarbamoyltransferase complex transferase subunit TsaD [Candidatus Pacebacteria bacterium]|nr:tRNA (adenosine(37)-N6)-threonylcarbamoyltransferase complex transferase subunit TsaD [Candidatus Paceibacterota bacterium]MBP9819099.1 tRNA (adenosine(37)-N6)-threonylcarbamoyltransferase complex transferase subunit TsaD [Candidatus Paceibacterota bacterium]